MFILTRYVVWDTLKYFLAALIVLTLIITLGIGVQKGLQAGLPPLIMLETMPFMLPEMLGISIPVAMLFAVSTVFGRMTALNEIIALKSLGISPMVVVWPALVLAALLSLGTVWMYEIAALWCRPAVKWIVCESIEQIAYSALKKNGSYTSDDDQLTVIVQAVEGRKLIRPIIIIRDASGNVKARFEAAEAELRSDWSQKPPILEILCTDTKIDWGGVKWTDRGTMRYPLPMAPPPVQRYHRDWVAMRDIPRLIGELEAGIRGIEQYREANKALGVAESPDDDAKIAYDRFQIARLRTEMHRRWSNGFTCLCFAMIGVPVAMLRRHADILANFFTCFLPILAVYYPVWMFGEHISTTGKAWPVSFWMANALLALAAVVLLRRIVRH